MTFLSLLYIFLLSLENLCTYFISLGGVIVSNLNSYNAKSSLFFKRRDNHIICNFQVTNIYLLKSKQDPQGEKWGILQLQCSFLEHPFTKSIIFFTQSVGPLCLCAEGHVTHEEPCRVTGSLSSHLATPPPPDTRTHKPAGSQQMRAARPLAPFSAALPSGARVEASPLVRQLAHVLGLVSLTKATGYIFLD